MNNNSSRSRRKLPILLFDVMDTLVRDPFYQDVPAFFRLQKLYEKRIFLHRRYEMIKDKLKLSTYLSWTFCSFISGIRKHDAEFYLEVLNYLKVDPPSCIFIDDRMKNVEAAIEAAFIVIQLKNVDLLRKELSIHSINISESENNENVSECLE